MPRDVKKILEDALKLPPEARAALAGTLLESIDEPTDDGAEEAWAAEVKRRLDALDSGASSSVPWPEARRRILGA